ncbi:MAG TPA: hypothetical protein PK322_11825 [Opitutaceae bacterium]|nr:hypothetical protein [Opitutaceae bacterium]
MSFAGVKRRQLSLERGNGPKGLRAVATMLRWIGDSGAKVSGWKESGVAEILGAAKTLEEIGPSSADRSDADLFRRAEVALAALQIKEVIGACAAIIGRRSEQEAAAARLKIKAELLDGRVENALDTLAELIRLHPEEVEARALVAFHLVNSDDKRGLQLAGAVLDRALAKHPSLVLSVAGYHLRRKEWDQTATMLDRLETSGAVLNDYDREFGARIRADLERLRNDPKQAFRQVTFGLFKFRLRAWLPLLVIGALCLWPLCSFGPLFARESWHLLQLRRRGAKADIVHVYRGRESIGTRQHFLASITYEFAPDRTRVNPLTLREPEKLSYKEFQAWSEMSRAQLRGEMRRGWYLGESLLFAGTANEIRAQLAEQFVTYLPDNPNVNAIGPITNTRIWLTWLGAPKAMLPGVAMIGVFGWISVREFLQRRRRHLRGFDPAQPVA